MRFMAIGKAVFTESIHNKANDAAGRVRKWMRELSISKRYLGKIEGI